MMSENKLKDELDRALKEIIRLDSENKRLVKIASSANENAAKANDLAKRYQKLFDELFQAIQLKYDPEFEVEDIPNYFS